MTLNCPKNNMIHLKYKQYVLIFRTNNKDIFNKYLKIANSFRILNILLKSEYNNNILFEYEYN